MIDNDLTALRLPTMDLNQLLQRHGQYRARQKAFVCGSTTLNYQQLSARVNTLIGALQAAGLRAGDRIALLLPNSVALYEMYWAAASGGFVVVPLSPLLQAHAIAALMADADIDLLIIDHAMTEQLAEITQHWPAFAGKKYWVRGGNQDGGHDEQKQIGNHQPRPVTPNVGAEHPFNIVYSSGTTGKPKGIVHTHRIRAMYGALFANSFRITPESVIMHAGAIVFNGAFVTMMPAWLLGTTYVLLDRFSPEKMMAAIDHEQVTHVMMVPSQIIALLNHAEFDPGRLASLEMIGSLGAPLLREDKERLQQALPGRFYELYGVTEGFVTILDKYDAALKPDSVGIPPPLFDIRIVDDHDQPLPPGHIGEICGRGPIMMTGYHGQEELSAKALRGGWVHSGDLGYVDEDGYLYLVDRKNDLIISGGVNIFPRDIEEVIATHPWIVETAVFGAPDEKWGESPIAAVVLEPASELTSADLKTWINQRVDAKYQRVKEVIIVPDLPRNIAGKTLKVELRRNYLNQPGGHSSTD